MQRGGYELFMEWVESLQAAPKDKYHHNRSKVGRRGRCRRAESRVVRKMRHESRRINFAKARAR